MRSSRRKFIYVAAAAVFVAALFIYSSFNPESSVWFPKCPVFMVTGFKCPGCGSQRMIHALLHGDLSGAFHHNAVLLLLLPLIIALVVVEPLRNRYPALYMRLNSNAVIVTALAVVVLWGIVRNFIGM